ncbi:MAG TPA: aminoglycoside phosphotransferase family protein [Pseudonocardiaceae bacterium]|jgi:aminoglycoside phosphotransferase (APT) family kinase protein
MSDEPIEPTPELVHTLIAGQFPEWSRLPVRPVGKPGVDNKTFRLGEDKLVRMPRFSRWVGQVRREQRWLPVLAPHLPLAVPVPLAQGEPGDGYPFPWSVYAWLTGENASRAALADHEQAATDLAGFLGALWSIDATDGPPPEWSNGFRGVGVGDESDSAVVAWRIEKRIAALAGLVDTDALRAVYADAVAAPVWAKSPVWVHGDPAPGNLLIRDGRLSAVIDFGTLAVGDPAVDLIGAWTLLDPHGRDLFRAALDIDDATWARGRAWALSALLPAPDAVDDDARRNLAELIG